MGLTGIFGWAITMNGQWPWLGDARLVANAWPAGPLRGPIRMLMWAALTPGPSKPSPMYRSSDFIFANAHCCYGELVGEFLALGVEAAVTIKSHRGVSFAHGPCDDRCPLVPLTWFVTHHIVCPQTEQTTT